MPSEEIHELARQHPEEFKNVVDYCDGRLGEKLAEVYQEEQATADSPQVAVSD